MSRGMNDLERERERLSRLYPGWRIRVSGRARWWKATRTGTKALSAEEHVAGLACTLIEDTAEGLGAELALQTRIEDRLARSGR